MRVHLISAGCFQESELNENTHGPQPSHSWVGDKEAVDEGLTVGPHFIDAKIALHREAVGMPVCMGPRINESYEKEKKSEMADRQSSYEHVSRRQGRRRKLSRDQNRQCQCEISS